MLSTSRSGISRRIGPLNEIAQLRGLFDPRAALGAQMKNELTAVRVGEKILAEPRYEEKNCSAGQKKGGDEKSPPVNK